MELETLKKISKDSYIVLEKIRYFTRVSYYKIIFKDGMLYFCLLKKRDVQRKSGDLKTLTSESTEKALCHNKKNFKLDISKISSITINEEQDPWNNTNNGTVEINVVGQVKKYLISYRTEAEFLNVFLENIGCTNLTMHEKKRQYHKGTPHYLRILKFRKIVHKSPVWISAGAMVFIFFQIFTSKYIHAGIIILFSLTLISIFFLILYQENFAATIKRKPSKTTWSNLLSQAVFPPIVLFYVLLKNYEFFYPRFFLILVPIVAVSVSTFCVIKYKQLRNRVTATLIVFFAAITFYSSVIASNYLFNVKTIEKYPTIVHDMYTDYNLGRYRIYTYYIIFDSIPGKTEDIKVKVPFAVYRNLQMGKPVTLSLQSGLWNIEWYQVNS